MNQNSAVIARSNGRLANIDSFRYLLCFPVALLHALPGTDGQTTATWATLIASACRVAVPFFFIASGYFMRVPEVFTLQVLNRPLSRLLPIYVSWFLIYVAIDAFDGNFNALRIRDLVNGGSAFHLWFIPVLGVTLALVPTSIVLIGIRATVLVAAALAIIGVLMGSYREVLHIREVIGMRLTMAPAFLLIGYLLARSNIRIGIARAAAATVVALLLLIIEEWLIAYASETPFTSHATVFMTYPLGAAVFLLSTSLGESVRIETLARLGLISLGVYSSHLIFLRILQHWTGHDTPERALLLAVTAILSATVFSKILDGIPLVRRLVR